MRNLGAHNFHWSGYNERLIVFILSVKKTMFKMFTVGEMAANSPHANAETATLQSCQKQTLHQFARHLLLVLIYSLNVLKGVKVGKVLTEVDTC